MAKRASKRASTKAATGTIKKPNSTDRLRKALMALTKPDLVGLIFEFVTENKELQRRLELQLKIEPVADELVAHTRRAIADATDFDVREINRNFSYDYAAYKTVERNFKSLVQCGQFSDLMMLAIELMRKASYQVEMSDEGLMSDDIEQCLKVVVTALAKSKLPAVEIVQWCNAMLAADAVGCLFEKELKTLRQRFAS